VRARIRLLVLLGGVVLVAGGVAVAVLSYRLKPIGPADFRMQWDGYWQLRKELGPAVHGAGMNILSFTPDRSGSGEYKVYFYHDQERGYMYWHYDRSVGLTFERIEQNGK
jgi:hypothetical protein